MPQPSDSQIEELTEEEFISSIDNSDYIFIMTKDGSLKSILIPEDMENLELPDNIKQVMKIFELDNLVTPRTLH